MLGKIWGFWRIKMIINCSEESIHLLLADGTWLELPIKVVEEIIKAYNNYGYGDEEDDN